MAQLRVHVRVTEGKGRRKPRGDDRERGAFKLNKPTNKQLFFNETRRLAHLFSSFLAELLLKDN